MLDVCARLKDQGRLVPCGDELPVIGRLVQVVDNLLLQLSSTLFLSHSLQAPDPFHLIDLFLLHLALLTAPLIELLQRQLAVLIHAIVVVLPEQVLESAVDLHWRLVLVK